jgi:hypothetical protein
MEESPERPSESDTKRYVWVFLGEGAVHPCAVFSSLELAEEWILSSKVSGILTKYQLDLSVYDWTIGLGYFKPSKPYQSEPKFVQKFSSAYAEHYHYENGKNLT